VFKYVKHQIKIFYDGILSKVMEKLITSVMEKKKHKTSLFWVKAQYLRLLSNLGIIA
jgi:hypothetical protein